MSSFISHEGKVLQVESSTELVETGSLSVNSGAPWPTVIASLHGCGMDCVVSIGSIHGWRWVGPAREALLAAEGRSAVPTGVLTFDIGFVHKAVTNCCSKARGRCQPMKL